MKNYVSAYMVDLVNTLEQRSVDDLIEFIDKWVKKGVIDKGFQEYFLTRNSEVQLGTLCKMICNAKCSHETKVWARKKLEEIGMSEEII